MKTEKIFFFLLAIIIAITSYVIYDSQGENIVVGAILLLSAVVMISTVAWEKFNNGRPELEDVTSIIGMVLTLVLFVSSILFFLEIAIPEWMQNLVVVSLGAVSLTVGWIAIKK